MVYKRGPRYRVRPVADICEDLDEAGRVYGDRIRTVFFPAGNTIAMPTEELASICRYAHGVFPKLERITVYGSSRYICEKGPANLARLREAGLSRVHVGMESGDDEVLRRIKKGTTLQEQIEAGLMLKGAGIELSEYVILGIGGRERSREHALATADAVNAIEPHFLRLRTFVPKINTLLLHQIRRGRFQMCGPHEVLQETRLLLENVSGSTRLFSDHYTNYINLQGRLPEDIPQLLSQIDKTLSLDKNRFRPFMVGYQ
jgi:radical SAM superfamily enzyme YgiQ (UPF0313 family)